MLNLETFIKKLDIELEPLNTEANFKGYEEMFSMKNDLYHIIDKII